MFSSPLFPNCLPQYHPRSSFPHPNAWPRHERSGEVMWHQPGGTILCSLCPVVMDFSSTLTLPSPYESWTRLREIPPG